MKGKIAKALANGDWSAVVRHSAHNQEAHKMAVDLLQYMETEGRLPVGTMSQEEMNRHENANKLSAKLMTGEYQGKW